MHDKVKTYQFKKLEIQHTTPWWKRTLTSPHTRKTFLYTVLGALIGYLLFYFDDGLRLGIFWNETAFQNITTGAVFGIFITNSPCARGKC